MSADNLEEIFNKMNNHINIDNDREKYANCFNTLRDKIFDILRSDPAFKSLFNGFQLGGGYGDNLKVNKPDEYDLVFYLQLPETSKVIVRKDTSIPGNVFLDLTKVFDTIRNQAHRNVVYKLLMKFVTDKNVLIVDELQKWLKSCFQLAINKLGTSFNVGGETLNFEYRNCGPAHTMFVQGKYEFSVDFVPAIKLDPAQSVLSQNLCNNLHWEAIPKPLKIVYRANQQLFTKPKTSPPKPRKPKPKSRGNCSFRASYYLAENRLLRDNNNLKNALRFMKKFRDRHPNMKNLKSYYIKTLFLWKLKSENRNYWRSSLSSLVFYMFRELEKCLFLRKLPFYWDPDLNMFQDLSNQQLTEMLNCVEAACCTLQRASNELTEHLKYEVRKLFMNQNERTNDGIVNPSAPKRLKTTTTLPNSNKSSNNEPDDITEENRSRCVIC